MSMADYTRERYHNEIPGTIYDLSTAISSIGLIAGQIMAGKALFEALGLPGNVGAIAIAVVVLLYPSFPDFGEHLQPLLSRQE